MTLGRSLSVAMVGMDGHVVEVEADVADGLPHFGVVGLPDASLNEARDRVRAAAANAGHPVPPRRIVVNLSPASLPKTGTGFDLAIAVAVLAAAGKVPPESVAHRVHLGELGLDGRVRPVRGVLPAVMAAVAAGHERVVVPSANAAEAALVPGVSVAAVNSLGDIVADLRGEPAPVTTSPARPDQVVDPVPVLSPDLVDVVGQDEARHAVEVAAAGGHHLLLLGPPGAGKTMLAARLPGLLPDLDLQSALEVTAVHSLSGTLAGREGRGSVLITRPPFEDPHHTASAAAVVGGGTGIPRPGAASRAHRGVLFMDETPEFDTRVLEALRQPLEHGELVIHRSRGSARYPARFQLVLAANPCPCGRAGGRALDCTCSPAARRRYLTRLSGPLLDRVDLQVEVAPVSRAHLAMPGDREGTATVAARVRTARAAQTDRLQGTTARTNADVGGSLLRGGLRLPTGVTRDVDRALDRGSLSVRGYDRVLRVAWTIADLGGRDSPGRDEVGRALTLRQRGRVAA